MSELMQPVVDAMCKSLREEPYEWNINVHTLSHKSKFKKQEFWNGVDAYSNKSITEVWDGSSNATVFSHEQGKEIYQALNEAIALVGSDKQKDLLDSL
jgi:hypothetical protein